MANKFDYTEGEWEIVNNEKIIVNEKYKDPIDICDNVTVEANARLISFAPEMLMALIEDTKENEKFLNIKLKRPDTSMGVGIFLISKLQERIQLIEKATGKKWSEINES